MPPDHAARFSRLVDALITPAPGSGAEPPALLVQKNRRDAAVLLGGERLVVLLACAEGEPLGPALAARVDAALAAEREEVLAGARQGAATVILVGGPSLASGPAQAEAALPAIAPATSVVLDWLRLDGATVEEPPPAKGLTTEAREHLASARSSVRDALEAAAARIEAGEVAHSSAEALRASERAGEHVLATEGLYARRLDRIWPLYIGLGAALVAVWSAQLVFGGGTDQVLYRMGSAWGRDVAAGQWWRLVCAGWLHAGLGHLGSNAIGLALFLGPVTAALGRRRTLVLFALSCAGGFAFTCWLKPDEDGVGASGGIFGLMAALLCLGLRRKSDYLPSSSGCGWAGFAALYLGFNLVMSLRGGVSMMGHVGGGLTGAALVLGRVITFGLTPLDRGPQPAWGRALASAALAATVGVTLYAFGIQLSRQHPWVIRWPPPVVEATFHEVPYALRAPRSLFEAMEQEEDGDSHEYVAGTLRADPIVLALNVRPRAASLPKDEERALAALVARYDRARREKPLGAQPAVPTIVTAGAHKWVYLDDSWSKRDNVREERWIRADVDHEIDLIVYRDAEANRAWVLAGEAVPGTLTRVR